MAHDPYLILNGVFIVIIAMVLLYSGIFSAEKDNHPIPSYYEKLTGKPAPTSGLSKSFSAIVRLQFDEAKKWNPFGISIFSFFLIQFLMRMGTSVVIFKHCLPRKILILMDSTISFLLFIICFRNLLLFWRFM